MKSGMALDKCRSLNGGSRTRTVKIGWIFLVKIFEGSARRSMDRDSSCLAFQTGVHGQNAENNDKKSDIDPRRSPFNFHGLFVRSMSLEKIDATNPT